jgi:hypothetical protein
MPLLNVSMRPIYLYATTSVLLEHGSTEDEPRRVPLTIICGFLGAGKSTFLKYAFRHYALPLYITDGSQTNID